MESGKEPLVLRVPVRIMARRVEKSEMQSKENAPSLWPGSSALSVSLLRRALWRLTQYVWI